MQKYMNYTSEMKRSIVFFKKKIIPRNETFNITYFKTYHPYGSGNIIRNHSPNTDGCRGNSFSINICLFLSNGSFSAGKII